MPKSAPAATSKTTKQASKNTAKEPKEKRPPSAYNVFVKEQLPIWKSEHPDVSAKEAMKGVRALWASAEENPNRGKSSKSKKTAAAANSSAPPSSQPVSDSDTKENDVPSSDD